MIGGKKDFSAVPKKKKEKKVKQDLPKIDAIGMKGVLTPEKAAKRRKRRNIAIAVGSTSAAVLAMLMIIAFLGRVSGNFTISIDPRDFSNRLGLSYEVDGSMTSTMLGSGLSEAKPVAASQVFNHIDSFDSSAQLSGENSLYEGEGDSRRNYALVYTWYLRNKTDDEVTYRVTLNVSDYVSPTNEAIEPYEYLRVAVFVNPVLTFPGAEQTHDYTVYGLQSRTAGTAEDDDDVRECISQFSTDEDGRRNPMSTDNQKSSGYCTPFLDTKGRIFDLSGMTIAPSAAVRYTLVAWLEGYDPECRGKAPEGASMTFSLEYQS